MMIVKKILHRTGSAIVGAELRGDASVSMEECYGQKWEYDLGLYGNIPPLFIEYK